MKETMRFVDELQAMHPLNPVKISIRHSNAQETEIIAEDSYGNRAIMLGIRADGTVVRYVGQEAALKSMGFQTEGAFVKMFN